jgi:hypothetical protein
VNNSDERDHAEETANRAEMQEQDHCIRCVASRDPESGGSHDDDCVHCECCCACLGCEYGSRDGMPLTAEQRAPIAAVTLDYDDVPPNAGSAS